MPKELIIWKVHDSIPTLRYRTKGGDVTERGALYHDAEGHLTGSSESTLREYLIKGHEIKIHDPRFPENVRTTINKLEEDYSL